MLRGKKHASRGELRLSYSRREGKLTIVHDEADLARQELELPRNNYRATTFILAFLRGP
jgi:hypothetical protein